MPSIITDFGSAGGQPTPVFDWTRMRQVYVGRNLLTDEQFDKLVESAVRISALGVAGPRWGITHLILSAYRSLPLTTHYEALSAGYGFPFSGVMGFHEHLIERGVTPAWTLNQTVFYRVPSPNLRIGELMTELGLAEPSTVARCMEVQKVIRERFGTQVALGSLLLTLSPLAFPDFFHVLAIQAGIPYRGMDESAARAFDLLGQKLAQPKR